MPFEIKPGVHWVGKVDWELRTFHGQEYSTHRGSSYNAYLVRGERTVLIDTVWGPYAEEFVAGLAALLPLDQIDHVVMNHNEPDHAGSLARLMREIPGVPVHCSRMALQSIPGQFHGDWNLVPHKTGDVLDLGAGRALTFVEMNMLHWPDSMASYLSGDGILFSNDAFGQHVASEGLYADTVDPCELWAEAVKYYANILTPFSGLLQKKLAEIAALGVPIEMICPSHGVIWRENPMQIVERYAAWADAYAEDRVVLLYDTMWDATRLMAEAIADGLRQALPGTEVRLFNTARTDKNDCITEIFRARGVLVGSPTINRGILHSVAGLLEVATGLKFQGKKAAAFGSFGWSGESVKHIAQALEQAGFEVVDPGLRLKWRPDAGALEQCREFGRRFAAAL